MRPNPRLLELTALKIVTASAPATAARPSLLLGRVYHRRLRPVVHAFSYRVYALRLPLRALAADESLWGNRWFSHNRFNLLSFHDRDHGDGGLAPLAWITRVLEQAGIHDATGEIWLQTFPRVLGYVFNPVSFWFCQRPDGSLRTVVCEVNNTFGERHCYLLETGATLKQGEPLHAPKAFHVSPFCEVAGHYVFRFMTVAPRAVPAALHPALHPLRTLARIDYYDAQGPLLLTSISANAYPLDSKRSLSAFIRFPMMTLGVVLRIHWQALKLLLKRVPFLGKPEAPKIAPK